MICARSPLHSIATLSGGAARPCSLNSASTSSPTTDGSASASSLAQLLTRVGHSGGSSEGLACPFATTHQAVAHAKVEAWSVRNTGLRLSWLLEASVATHFRTAAALGIFAIVLSREARGAGEVTELRGGFGLADERVFRE